jgi:hypothetical protein
MSDETPPLPPGPPPVDPQSAAGTPPEEPAATPEPPPVCSTCQASLDADQTYCLECGAPTPLAPGLRKRQRGLIAVATGALLLGGGAGALAYHLGTSDGGKSSLSVGTGVVVPPTVGTLSGDPTFTGGGLPTVATTPGVSTDIPPTDTIDTSGTSDTSGGSDTGTGVSTSPPTLSDSTDTQSTESTESTPDLTPSTTTEDSSPSAGGDDWPGGDAWTVQVSSVRNRAGADRLVKRMKAAGKDAGVLASADHEGFRRSGYWVVFSGTFPTKAEAVAAQTTLGGSFGRTIVRRVRS